MDQLDKKILRVLQEDCTLPISKIANRVGLSASPCWKRIARLREQGIIKKEIAVLSADHIGFGLTVFVSIKTGEHSAEWLERFSQSITQMVEVVELHRMAGDVDYMLKVVVTGMAEFDDFYKKMISVTELNEVTSRFSMETIKETTAFPI
jgi:Lrp/AsnC family transcriptional regulator